MKKEQVEKMIIGDWKLHKDNRANGLPIFSFKKNIWEFSSVIGQRENGKYAIEEINEIIYLKGVVELTIPEEGLEICALSEKYILLKSELIFLILIRIK